jgi:hypothetical protein
MACDKRVLQQVPLLVKQLLLPLHRDDVDVYHCYILDLVTLQATLFSGCVYNTPMQRNYSPEALARREARKAETKARNEAKKAALQAARMAELDARNKAYLDAQQKRREDFKASLSDADWADLQEALSEETTMTDSLGLVRVTNEWLHSVKYQFHSKGWLSVNQLTPLLNKVRQRREQALKAESWPVIQEGDKLKLFCTVVKSEVLTSEFGRFYKITMLTHYGRKCFMKTGREAWHSIALSKKESGKKVFVHAKVKWIAPEPGGLFVLTSAGAVFGDLL